MWNITAVHQLRREPYCAPLSALKSVTLDTFVISRHLYNTADGDCGAKALGMLLEEAQSLQTLRLHGNGGEDSQPHFL